MTYYSGFVPNPGVSPANAQQSRAVSINETVGGIAMVGALLNDQGLRVLMWDTQGNIYFTKKNTSQNPNNQDLLFCDQFSILPSAGRYTWATDNDMIAYSHLLSLGSDIPASPQPTLTAGAGLGTGPTIGFLAGTWVGDGSMALSLKTGTTPAAGALVTATFVESFTNEPNPIITPYGLASMQLQPYLSNVNTTSATLSCAVAPAASTTYFFLLAMNGY